VSYQALYRVWRPQQFIDVVGQEHVTKTLQNALLQEKISHAYLFSGPRGTGKTARRLRLLNRAMSVLPAEALQTVLFLMSLKLMLHPIMV
jgi:DNA polymerase III gamma/tau subunit